MAQQILHRTDRFLNRLPLLAQQVERWGQQALFESNGVPIVYGQPLPLSSTRPENITQHEGNTRNYSSGVEPVTDAANPLPTARVSEPDTSVAAPPAAPLPVAVSKRVSQPRVNRPTQNSDGLSADMAPLPRVVGKGSPGQVSGQTVIQREMDPHVGERANIWSSMGSERAIAPAQSPPTPDLSDFSSEKTLPLSQPATSTPDSALSTALDAIPDLPIVRPAQRNAFHHQTLPTVAASENDRTANVGSAISSTTDHSIASSLATSEDGSALPMPSSSLNQPSGQPTERADAVLIQPKLESSNRSAATLPTAPAPSFTAQSQGAMLAFPMDAQEGKALPSSHFTSESHPLASLPNGSRRPVVRPKPQTNIAHRLISDQTTAPIAQARSKTSNPTTVTPPSQAKSAGFANRQTISNRRPVVTGRIHPETATQASPTMGLAKRRQLPLAVASHAHNSSPHQQNPHQGRSASTAIAASAPIVAANATHNVTPLSPPEAPMPPGAVESPGSSSKSASEIDIDHLSNQVERRIMRRLVVESERRGRKTWF